LDRHMGDMIVPYMALADGVSEVSMSRLTEHTLTNVKVAEELGGVRFEVNGKVGEPGSLRVKGLGFSSPR
jgi:RNA 3'-terminal phosphate cyclase (ATP)